MASFVLKVSSTGMMPEILEGINIQMIFLSRHGFPCCHTHWPPGVVGTLNSHPAELLGTVDDPAAETQGCVEVKYPIRVLEFIPGEIMDKLDESLLSTQLTHSVGKMAGEMDLLLQVTI